MHLIRREDQLAWLTARLQSVLDARQRAHWAGECATGDQFYVAATRLIGLLWLREVLAAPPCVTYRGELAMAWWQFRRARRALAELGLIAPLDAA